MSIEAIIPKIQALHPRAVCVREKRGLTVRLAKRGAYGVIVDKHGRYVWRVGLVEAKRNYTEMSLDKLISDFIEALERA